MSDYIIRADVLAKSQIMNDFSWATGCGILTDVAAVPVIEIEAIPAADVRPVVHGHWRHEHLASTSGGTYEVIRCSECGWSYPMFETVYCPCCGADMRPREWAKE